MTDRIGLNNTSYLPSPSGKGPGGKHLKVAEAMKARGKSKSKPIKPAPKPA